MTTVLTCGSGSRAELMEELPTWVLYLWSDALCCLIFFNFCTSLLFWVFQSEDNLIWVTQFCFSYTTNTSPTSIGFWVSWHINTCCGVSELKCHKHVCFCKWQHIRIIMRRKQEHKSLRFQEHCLESKTTMYYQAKQSRITKAEKWNIVSFLPILYQLSLE